MKKIAFALVLAFYFIPKHFSQVVGCTDALAINYNSLAEINDGSCVYSDLTIDVEWSVNLPEIVNGTSGLIFVGEQLVTHNDHGEGNFYFINPANPTEIDVVETQLQVKDWEELQQDEDYFYLGDFGNNESGNRTDLMVFRISKTNFPNDIDTIFFSYENQVDFTAVAPNSTNFDCEAFIVTDNNLYLFTKEWETNHTSVYKLPKTPGDYTATYIETYDVEGLITGAAYLDEERIIALSGYTLTGTFIYLLYDFKNHNFFSGNKRKVNLNLNLHQVEGIATQDGLIYYITNEYASLFNFTVPAKLHQVNLSEILSDYLEVSSLSKSQKSVFNVYPNPVSTNQNLYIGAEINGLCEVEITDLNGRILFQKEFLSLPAQINLSEYIVPGLYNMTLKNEGNEHMLKVVVL